MTVKSSISLTDQQDAFVRSLVEQGRYSSFSAVVQESLEAFRHKTELKEAEIAALRKFFEQRAAEPTYTLEEFDDRIDAMLERKKREYGL